MKLKKLLTKVCLVLCFSASTAMAAGVGVVDMQKIFKNSAKVKAESAKLSKKFAVRRAGIMKMDQALQKTFADLQKNSAVMSKKQLAAKRMDAEKQEVAMRSAQQKFQADVLQAQNAAMASFMDKARLAAAKVASTKKLNIILLKNAVLYASGTTDITNAVMKQIG